jgi:hypothetical protein
MPFRRTEMASNGVKSDTASMTSESEVKRLLKPTRNIKIMADRTTLMRMLFPFTTKTENFATLG